VLALRKSARVREPPIRAIERADRARLPHEGDGFPDGSRRLLRGMPAEEGQWPPTSDRKSTRLNSSHVKISYAVFCLKKKKKTHNRNLKKKKTENKHDRIH